ncbi:MAG: hypothetical protein J6386_03705 [Candidatus Synoicihabitans palmerolidicus]|nr:hypothetical protein [Candidatus Synoicihabitans palmerolidicus]
MVIDHCSTTWAVDENLSVSGPRLEGTTSFRVTISNCLIAEGLDDSSHAKGPHFKGTLIHDRIKQVAIIGCLYASNVDRNPYFKIGSSGVVANTVIYNPGRNAIKASWMPEEWEGRIPPQEPELSVVGNIVIHGPDTAENVNVIGARVGKFYVDANRRVLRDGSHDDGVPDESRIREQPLVWVHGLQVTTPDETLAAVTRRVGARPFDRDPIDQRIVDEGLNGGGGVSSTVRMRLAVTRSDSLHTES